MTKIHTNPRTGGGTRTQCTQVRARTQPAEVRRITQARAENTNPRTGGGTDHTVTRGRAEAHTLE